MQPHYKVRKDLNLNMLIPAINKSITFHNRFMDGSYDIYNLLQRDGVAYSSSIGVESDS